MSTDWGDAVADGGISDDDVKVGVAVGAEDDAVDDADAEEDDAVGNVVGDDEVVVAVGAVTGNVSCIIAVIVVVVPASTVVAEAHSHVSEKEALIRGRQVQFVPLDRNPGSQLSPSCFVTSTQRTPLQPYVKQPDGNGATTVHSLHKAIAASIANKKKTKFKIIQVSGASGCS